VASSAKSPPALLRDLKARPAASHFESRNSRSPLRYRHSHFAASSGAALADDRERGRRLVELLQPHLREAELVERGESERTRLPRSAASTAAWNAAAAALLVAELAPRLALRKARRGHQVVLLGHLRREVAELFGCLLVLAPLLQQVAEAVAALGPQAEAVAAELQRLLQRFLGRPFLSSSIWLIARR
jgi:hypothetical protein